MGKIWLAVGEWFWWEGGW